MSSLSIYEDQSQHQPMEFSLSSRRKRTLTEILSYHNQAQFTLNEDEDATPLSSTSSDDQSEIIGTLSSPSSQYLVRSILGEGSYGIVTKCVNMETRKTVALKIFKNRNITPEKETEVLTLKLLSDFDPDRFNFVRYNSFFVKTDFFFIEYEMLDQTLYDFLKDRPSHCMAVKEIRPILHQMATTLQLLKCLGIVHTDLKTDNIMLVDHAYQPFRIKVIDFGLAFSPTSQWPWGVALLPYRSPETILGLPVTAAIDMWSLGCIAAELFLGTILYPGRCEYEMLQHIMQTQGELPQKMLDDGLNTKRYFRRERSSKRRWNLKDPGGQTKQTVSYFKCLDDIKKFRPVCHLSEEDTRAEIEDRQDFVDLLKRMLQLDCDERLTPSQMFQHAFITMNNLSKCYPNSFYVKVCCEMMDACQHQYLSSDNWCHQSVQWDQRIPAWFTHKEHPLLVGIASTMASSLSINEDQTSPQSMEPSLSTRKERTLSEGPFPNAGNSALVRQRVESKASQSGERSQQSPLPEAERIKTDKEFIKTRAELLQSSKEVPADAPTSTAKSNRKRKRTIDEDTGSPERKRRRMNFYEVEPQTELLQSSKEAPAEATNSTAKANLKRKRAVDQDTGLPERKRRKMNSYEVVTQTVKVA